MEGASLISCFITCYAQITPIMNYDRQCTFVCFGGLAFTRGLMGVGCIGGIFSKCSRLFVALNVLPNICAVTFGEKNSFTVLGNISWGSQSMEKLKLSSFFCKIWWIICRGPSTGLKAWPPHNPNFVYWYFNFFWTAKTAPAPLSPVKLPDGPWGHNGTLWEFHMGLLLCHCYLGG